MAGIDINTLSLLHFDDNITDLRGNTWTVGGGGHQFLL